MRGQLGSSGATGAYLGSRPRPEAGHSEHSWWPGSACVLLTATYLHATCSDKTPAALFFRYNTQLGPPYQVRAPDCSCVWFGGPVEMLRAGQAPLGMQVEGGAASSAEAARRARPGITV